MLLDVREILASGVAGASDKTVIHDQYRIIETLKAGSSVPVTTVAAFSQALSTGTATIDLTSLTGTNGASVDATGLKLQAMYVENTSGNATLEVDVGASNGYNLGNSAATEIHLGDGMAGMFFYNEGNPDVGASAKDIDLVGTGSEASKWIMVFG